MKKLLFIIFIISLISSCSNKKIEEIPSTRIITVVKVEDKVVERIKYIDEYNIPTDFVPPIEDYNSNMVSSKFGFRESPMGGIEGKFNMHKGVDLVGKKNAKIYAVKEGRVVIHFPPPGTKSRRGNIFTGHPIYGGLIIIDHGNGLFTFYAHMKSTFVAEGSKVNRGQVIGIQGSTGDSTGDHLHFEILLDPRYALDDALKFKDGRK
jgi:murein DD-endopeptidase MepM/ murein hydrolase activator NlpD